jgi:hypothetical protein
VREPPLPVRSPCAGGVTIVYVRFASLVSTSLTSAPRSIPSGLSSATLTEAGLACGVSLTGSTVIDTVRVADVSAASQGALVHPSGSPPSVTS